MSRGSRIHFAKIDAARERAERLRRVAQGSGEYVYLTDEEHHISLIALGYIPGASPRGEGMGES